MYPPLFDTGKKRRSPLMGIKGALSRSLSCKIDARSGNSTGIIFIIIATIIIIIVRAKKVEQKRLKSFRSSQMISPFQSVSEVQIACWKRTQNELNVPNCARVSAGIVRMVLFPWSFFHHFARNHYQSKLILFITFFNAQVFAFTETRAKLWKFC